MQRSAPPQLPRAQPGYIHWLEKQSMLAQAPDLIAQVSQSERMWLHGASGKPVSILLEAAPTWLEFSSHQTPGHLPFFSLLQTQIPDIAAAGYNGIYLGDTSESAAIWVDKNQDVSASASASLNFAPDLGDDGTFEQMALQAENNGLQLGSSLLPAATGMGPDFLLQARKASGYAGLYAMLAVPKEYWEILPQTQEEWDFKTLDADMLQALAAKEILPERIARDDFSWASQGGWAATGPIQGTDGQIRRWVYRYDQNPKRPVLSWQDPTAKARSLFGAAIIRQTGLQGQALTGLHLEPLLGLDPSEENNQFAPGLEAVNSLTEQIHRYGGWAMFADPLPADLIAKILAGPCDFCMDALTPALLYYGLIRQDAAPLAALYKSWRKAGLQQNRLVRKLNMEQDIETCLLSQKMRDEMASGASQPRFANLAQNQKFAKLRHFLFNIFLGLPGLTFIDESNLATSEENQSSILFTLLQRRKDTGLANGTIEMLWQKAGSMGVLTKLPNGGYWLMAFNLGPNAKENKITLPGAVGRAIDITAGEDLNGQMEAGNTQIQLSLEGLEAKNIIFIKE